MTKMNVAKLRGSRLAGLSLLIAVLSACGGQSEPVSPSEQVSERAQAWANALMAKNLEAAFEYTTPAYRKFATTGHYHARIAGASRWTSAKVGKVECNVEDLCSVRMVVEYDIPHMGVKNSRSLDYRWVKSEGQWWIYVPTK